MTWLRRFTPLRPKPRPMHERVTSDVRLEVLHRDGMCLAARLGFEHECRNGFGIPHRPDDLDQLTMEHVHDGYGKAAKRADSDLAHLVALCHSRNVAVPSKEMRAAFRDWIASRDERYRPVPHG